MQSVWFGFVSYIRFTHGTVTIESDYQHLINNNHTSQDPLPTCCKELLLGRHGPCSLVWLSPIQHPAHLMFQKREMTFNMAALQNCGDTLLILKLMLCFVLIIMHHVWVGTETTQLPRRQSLVDSMCWCCDTPFTVCRAYRTCLCLKYPHSSDHHGGGLLYMIILVLAGQSHASFVKHRRTLYKLTHFPYRWRLSCRWGGTILSTSFAKTGLCITKTIIIFVCNTIDQGAIYRSFL